MKVIVQEINFQECNDSGFNESTLTLEESVSTNVSIAMAHTHNDIITNPSSICGSLLSVFDNPFWNDNYTVSCDDHESLPEGPIPQSIASINELQYDNTSKSDTNSNICKSLINDGDRYYTSNNGLTLFKSPAWEDDDDNSVETDDSVYYDVSCDDSLSSSLDNSLPIFKSPFRDDDAGLLGASDTHFPITKIFIEGDVIEDRANEVDTSLPIFRSPSRDSYNVAQDMIDIRDVSDTWSLESPTNDITDESLPYSMSSRNILETLRIAEAKDMSVLHKKSKGKFKGILKRMKSIKLFNLSE